MLDSLGLVHASERKLPANRCTGCRTYVCWLCGKALPPTNPYSHFTANGCPAYNPGRPGAQAQANAARHPYVVAGAWAAPGALGAAAAADAAAQAAQLAVRV